MNATSRSLLSFLAIGLMLLSGYMSGLTHLNTAYAAGAPASGTTFSLTVCRAEGDVTFPNAASHNGDAYVCPDNKDYTPGMADPHDPVAYHELDNVPMRLEINSKSAQTYTMTVAADYINHKNTGKFPGFDRLSGLFLNTALSSATGCPTLSATPATGNPSNPGPLPANTFTNDSSVVGYGGPTLGAQIHVGPNGIDMMLYRQITITQAAKSDCVYDYYGRLAIGSSGNPGASLHFNLLNGDLSHGHPGDKDVPIDSEKIAGPPSISKDMHATQSDNYTWNLTTSGNGVNFGNTCGLNGQQVQATQIVVAWSRSAADPSKITVTTNLYAVNPLRRSLEIDMKDTLYQGTTQVTQLASHDTGLVTVPSNLLGIPQLIKTYTDVINATDSGGAAITALNDVATATFTDPDDNSKIEKGNFSTDPPTSADFSPTPATVTINQGVVNSDNHANYWSLAQYNDDASLKNILSVAGPGLQLAVTSVDLSQANGATGSFAGGYVLGAAATSVEWDSANLAPTFTTGAEHGQATFNVNVLLNNVPSATTGSLTDAATLSAYPVTTPPEIVTKSVTAGISSSELATYTLTKNIPNILDGAETSSFGFTVTDNATGKTLYTPTLDFDASTGPSLNSSPLLLTVGNSYTFHESSYPAGQTWNQQPDQVVTVTGCSPQTVTFNNTQPPATVSVAKITVPSGYEAGWTFTLTGPGTPAGGEVVTTTSAAPVNFTTPLQEGSYSIAETPGTGAWAQTAASQDCSFTVNYPADAGHAFACQVTNTEQPCVAPTVKVLGVSNGVVTFDVLAATTGLLSIGNAVTSNATFNVPAFPVGTTSDVKPTATKTQTGIASSVKFDATAFGTGASCTTTYDPLLTSAVRDQGKPQTDTYTGIDKSESAVAIANGAPGVTTMMLSVNGKSFNVGGLSDNQRTTVDISSALVAGTNNTIAVTTAGRPGGSAVLLVGPPNK